MSKRNKENIFFNSISDVFWWEIPGRSWARLFCYMFLTHQTHFLAALSACGKMMEYGYVTYLGKLRDYINSVSDSLNRC